MRDDVLDERQRAALHALKPAAARGYYLAGGTGLCMHLEHRRSIDLDLFRTDVFDAEAMVSDLVAAGVRFESLRTSRATVHAEVEGVRTSLLCFPYPTIDAVEISPDGTPVAGMRDIAAMKIEAIASRGARRDFYDLYFICHDALPLERAMSAFEERFASARPDVYHRMRALTYFEDADQEPEPLLLRPAEWASVKSFFQDEVKRLWRAG